MNYRIQYVRNCLKRFGIMSGEDKIPNPQLSVAKVTTRMTRIRAQKFQEKRLAKAIARIARIRAQKFQKKRLTAGLNIVQKNFAWTVQEEYGLILMGDIGPNLTDVGSHNNCKYCFCRCVVNKMDSRLIDAALRCEHCRFYNRSTPKRCYRAIGNKSGSIAYILRHSALHRPDLGTEPVEESFTSTVTAAFKRWPVCCDPAPARHSDLWPRYREWIRFLLSSEEGEEESMVHWFTPRQHRNYLIMTQSYDLTDAVFHDGVGELLPSLKMLLR